MLLSTRLSDAPTFQDRHSVRHATCVRGHMSFRVLVLAMSSVALLTTACGGTCTSELRSYNVDVKRDSFFDKLAGLGPGRGGLLACAQQRRSHKQGQRGPAFRNRHIGKGRKQSRRFSGPWPWYHRLHSHNNKHVWPTYSPYAHHFFAAGLLFFAGCGTGLAAGPAAGFTTSSW